MKNCNILCRMTTGILFILILAASGKGMADETVKIPVPDDFAFSLPLQTGTDGALWKIMIPEQVYRTVTRPDLGDMRVFNGSGEAVPHELTVQNPGKSPRPEPVSVPFFPVYEDDNKTPSGLSVYFRTDAAGTVFRADPQPHTAEKGPAAWLVDAGALKRRPESLELLWENAGESFTASLSVDASTDLVRWSALVRNTGIVDMAYGGHRILQNRISLSGHSAKYFRISWPSGTEARLSGVRAVFPADEKTEIARMQLELAGKKAGETAWEFETGGYFPVDRVNVKPARRNSLVQAVLKSRNSPKETWRTRYQGVFYDLAVNSTQITSPSAALPVITDRYWRLETDTGTSTPPVLVPGWQPHELIFLASGDGPFSLAYGSARVKPAGESVNALLRNLEKTEGLIREAEFGKIAELGGEAALKPLPPPVPWKKLILWVLLVIGVLMVGWMAFRLYREMNAPEEPPPPKF